MVLNKGFQVNDGTRTICIQEKSSFKSGSSPGLVMGKMMTVYPTLLGGSSQPQVMRWHSQSSRVLQYQVEMLRRTDVLNTSFDLIIFIQLWIEHVQFTFFCWVLFCFSVMLETQSFDLWIGQDLQQQTQTAFPANADDLLNERTSMSGLVCGK